MLSWLGSVPAKPHHRQKILFIFVFVVGEVTASDSEVATKQSLVEETGRLTIWATVVMSPVDSLNMAFLNNPL